MQHEDERRRLRSCSNPPLRAGALVRLGALVRARRQGSCISHGFKGQGFKGFEGQGVVGTLGASDEKKLQYSSTRVL